MRPSPVAGRSARPLVFGLVLVTAGIGGLFLLRDNATLPDVPARAKEGFVPANLGMSWDKIDNPKTDGWDTEVLGAAADKVLKKIGQAITAPNDMAGAHLENYVSEQFACGDLFPEPRTTVFRDAVFHIERMASRNPPTGGNYTGQQGFLKALQALTAVLKDAGDIHTKFKLFRVLPGDKQGFGTVQYVAFSGHLPKGMVEHNATWEMQWKLDEKRASDGSPVVKLAGIKLNEFEIVHSTKQKEVFTDCTRSVMEKNDCYKTQFLYGMNHWYERIQDRRFYYLISHPGLAVGDVNGDGLDDLYVCQDEGLPNRLLLQQPDGTVKDVSDEWGVNWLHSSRGALIIDLDNDGKEDLVVAMVGHVVVAQNMGNRFEIKAILPTDGDTTSLCAADFDHDGKLDVYACVYHSKRGPANARGELLSGDAISREGHGGGKNSLFRNEIKNGAWKFTDVTDQVGLDEGNDRYSWAASWEDYDKDGWMDLYVVNDYGENQLYRNVGGKFKEVARSVGAEDDAFGMSSSWADYDQDGWMDVYIGNMFSGAGNRITFQEKFLPGKPGKKQKYQRFARGNTLLKNVNGKFTDVSEQAAVTMGRWAWSSNFIDINSDGLEDIMVANGFITTEDTGDL